MNGSWSFGSDRRVIAVVAALAAVGMACPVFAGSTAWDLTPIYPDAEAWEKSRLELVDKIDEMQRYQGRLGSSPKTLEAAFDTYFEIDKTASRLWGYASMLSDLDTRASEPQGMKQTLQSMFAEMSAELAWFDPELLALPDGKLQSFIEQEPGLADYARYVERLEKRRPHVLDPETEALLGLTGMIKGEGNTIATMLRNGEIRWDTVTLSDGSELEVDINGYTRGRALENRGDRKKVYDAFYGTLQRFKGSLAMTVAATAKEHVFNARVRHYDSTLEASVLNNEVDPDVYRMLVDEINASLPTLHRYLKLRGRMLGIDDLRYYDMYPELVGSVATEYDWDTTKKLVLDSLEPLGDDYVERLAKANEGGWIDVYPRKGKRSGAYVTHAAYDVHPYMLLNHQDDYDSATTYAHEAGHLMHSWYSQDNLPYALSEYEIFVAEVASTVNEYLFFKNMLAQAETDDERLALLGNFLEAMRLTVFRQTMFAEFELAVHEKAERGEGLTGDGLNAVYLDMLRRYHGHDEGVMQIDEPFAAEWAFIPHFHYNFYVYQYATSYVAAIALGKKILAGEPGAVESYLAFLRSGSTKPPVELLRDAGVDMTSPAPIRAAMEEMNDVISRIEAILAKKTS